MACVGGDLKQICLELGGDLREIEVGDGVRWRGFNRLRLDKGGGGSVSVWYVFFLAMLPVTELRATIPLAIAAGMAPWTAFFWSILGNGTAAVLVLLLLPLGYRLMRHFDWFCRLWDRVAAKTHNKGETVEKYGALGLLLFVAIPLPGTGVWTGVLLAFLLGIRPRYAGVAVLAGMVLAGVLVTLASLGVVSAAKAYGVEAAIFLVVVVLAFYAYYRYRKNRR